MKNKSALLLIIFLAGIKNCWCQVLVLPTKEQVAWADAEMGVIIHLDINIYSPDLFDYAQKKTLPDVNLFNPSKLNTDQWIRTAKAAGARYALLTAKHGTGFGLWPSKANTYNVGCTRWRNGQADIIKEFVASCKKYGLKPGLYYNTNINTYYNAGNHPFESDSAHAAYNKIVLQQLAELWTNYGDLFEIWFDGGIMADEKNGIEKQVLQLIHTLQPHAILFQGPASVPNIIRWIGNEDGLAAYPQWSRANTTTASDGLIKIDGLHGDPDGKLWCPGESDFPIRKNNAWNGGWLWKAGQDSYVFTTEELIGKYYNSIGRNSNMLIGMVVDTCGLIPRADSLAFDSLGRNIKKLFGSPVCEVKNYRGKTIGISLNSPKKLSCVLMQENIANGEKVRRYVITAHVKNKWKVIAEGESIGHKRIQTFAPVTTDKLRLTITEATGTPDLRYLAFYEASSQHEWGKWQTWGDAGNGSYNNPVLPEDYSDIDCIRVGPDYYAISSTFQYSPGLVILQSKDLVNWKVISHAVNDLRQISPEMNWHKMNRYGKGIWAGAIRYHDNKFWIYFGTADEGYFMTTAASAEGPWQPLVRVLAQKGWDDCCPFWDDDGQGYLVGTNFSDGYKIHLFRLTANGQGLVVGSDRVIHQSRGSEANKIYKVNGIYYHLFSEVRSDGRAIMMERAKNIYGPYTEQRQLNHPQRQFNEPNQGGIVQTQKGDWYFLTHHGTGDWSGREVSLLPVNWVDGWPVIGEPGPDKIGSMVWSGKKPVEADKITITQTSDEFSEASLPPQWEWNYQPRAEKWSLEERRGWLRLHAFTPIEAGNLLKAGNTLTQRTIRTETNEVVIKLDIDGMADGQKAGLSHFGAPSYSTLGVCCMGTTKRLEINIKGRIKLGPIINGRYLWLRSTWDLDGKSLYSYSIDGKTYIHAGAPYPLEWGSYRGDRIAIFCYNNKADAGYIDVDYFHYNYSK